MKLSELTFQLMVESTPNAILLVNRDGKIVYVNVQTERLFGYARNELIGQAVEELIPVRYRKKHPDFRNAFFQSPQVRPMGAGRDLFGLKKDGAEFPIEIGLNPVVTADGTLVLASIIDITERKIQEVTLIRKNELEAKNKELEQFAYLASHDLQEPLRTVSNYIQILEEDYGKVLDGSGTKHLKTIDLATKRMSALVKALLLYSRIGRDRKLVKTDCNLLLAEVISDLENLISKSGARISTQELPVLNVYDVEFRQLVQNLISNAIKFKKPNLTPDVKIECGKQGEFWRFSVTDNGIGIDSKHFDRIFYIFQRLHLENEYEGYGIGLANCKKIVELHGGKIWIESTPGTGSTFSFTIPNINL
ncbi:PAS domain-containing sensor histidine kinase [Leptospira ellisii]|nr:ATP-binding protein [Leptospira ellisii]PKA04060.1 PAS domain-containing sensor histidine kinase [Leptospira ellisii]